MRLERLRHQHGFAGKLKLTMIRWLSGHEPVDILKTLFYRPAFFGSPFSAVTHEVMRGASSWSVGERELFAAFVSNVNRCRF